MPVFVHYIAPDLVAPGSAAIIGACYRTEQLTDGAAGSASSGASLAIVINTEAVAKKVAWGSTPDTSATAATAATSAYLVIPPGGQAPGPITVTHGDKFISASA